MLHKKEKQFYIILKIIFLFIFFYLEQPCKYKLLFLLYLNICFSKIIIIIIRKRRNYNMISLKCLNHLAKHLTLTNSMLKRGMYEKAAFGFKQFEMRRAKELETLTFEKRKIEFESHLSNRSNTMKRQLLSTMPSHLERFALEDFLNSLTLLSLTKEDLHLVMDFYKK